MSLLNLDKRNQRVERIPAGLELVCRKCEHTLSWGASTCPHCYASVFLGIAKVLDQLLVYMIRLLVAIIAYLILRDGFPALQREPIFGMLLVLVAVQLLLPPFNLLPKRPRMYVRKTASQNLSRDSFWIEIKEDEWLSLNLSAAERCAAIQRFLKGEELKRFSSWLKHQPGGAEIAVASTAAEITEMFSDEELAKRLKAPDAVTRRDAISTIAKRGDPHWTTDLLSMLDDEDEFVRVYAAMALGALGDEAILSKLEDKKASVNADVQFHFDDAVAQIRSRCRSDASEQQPPGEA